MYTASFGQESPYGPFMKTGRGGAGNFNWKQDVERRAQQQQISDPESQTPQDRISLPSNDGNESEYLPTGRGGAGNYMSASEKETSLDQTSPATSAKPAAFSGRGGAGNFDSNTGNSKNSADSKSVDASERAALEKQIQQDVEMGLKRPEGAHIPVPEGREIGS